MPTPESSDGAGELKTFGFVARAVMEGACPLVRELFLTLRAGGVFVATEGDLDLISHVGLVPTVVVLRLVATLESSELVTARRLMAEVGDVTFVLLLAGRTVRLPSWWLGSGDRNLVPNLASLADSLPAKDDGA